MLAYTYPLADLFGTMLGLFVFFIWFWLLIVIFGDIFRSRDMGGGAKALWVIFVIILPFLGIFVYLIARGGKMHERAEQAAQQQQQAFDDYVKQTAGSRRQFDRRAGQAGRPQGPGRAHRRRVRGPEGQDPLLVGRGDDVGGFDAPDVRRPRPHPTPPDDRRTTTMYYLGGVVFAVLAIVLVVVFVKKFRQSND